MTPVPSKATGHPLLTRNSLIVLQEQRHARKYERWQRAAPMHLWQLDLVGGIYLASTVLTDHGKQFTGRFTKPIRAEVLFERICRENGITGRRIKPCSPTTTGKI
ncbi:hypothetical protein ACFV8Z_45320 [Streptomyces sp. NPDC059837]|uniref:hypothetical protein n=1 Tax=unclassified Streptomyces TaxID=2593676 RepID=UPI0022544A95|nr:hypothetical protein [Streptomyces sp. NBC_01764]MCX4403384.1 hypothetical protein [Streptomyces sp. NBC_01764]